VTPPPAPEKTHVRSQDRLGTHDSGQWRFQGPWATLSPAVQNMNYKNKTGTILGFC